MEKPHRASEAGDNSTDRTVGYTLADLHLCPFAIECHSILAELEDEGVRRRHCNQFFKRAELTNIFEGCA